MKVSARVKDGQWQVQKLTASTPQPQPLRISLPQLQAGQEVRIQMRYDEPASPSQLGMSLDDRVLGIYLMSLELGTRP